ncbi:SUMF1/EgtB/PvdO family nonheme iron enzyme [Planctomycetota bacterium]
MESFGNYQTVREFYREGYKLVSTARSGERSGEEYAVKQLKFVAAITDPEHLQAAQREFLDSVNVQMQTAAAGRFWALIHQSGETEDGAYYITDYYLRSLEHPIQGRVKLSARVLHTIMTAVVEGLLELKTKCGRPHGALKTTNVLLGDESDPARLRVVLTDPLPTARIDARQSTIDDFHAVGELIYRLILHRPFQALGGWPVEDSPEWQRLGKHGQAWRILCHRLLTPNLDPGTITLEDVAQQLAELKPTAKKLPLLGLVAGMFLVATVVGFLVLRNAKEENGTNGNILIDKQRWSTLCYDYQNWLTYFDNEGTIGYQLSPEDIKSLSDDPYLDDLLFKIPEKVASQKINLNPEKFTATDNTSNILELAQLDPGEVVPSDRIEHLNKTFDYISKIKDGLRFSGPEGGPYESAWPNLKIICQAETEFDKNWIAHGDIKSILDRFEQAFNQVGTDFQQQDVLLKELVNVVKKADEVDKIQKRWSSIKKLKPLAKPIIEKKNEEEKLQEKEERVNLAKMDDILAELSDLHGYLTGNIGDPVQRLAALRDYSFDSSALNDQWVDKRDALLPKNITTEKLKDKNNYPLYLEQLDKVDDVKVFLEQLVDDDQLPRGVPEYFDRFTSRTWFDRVFWKDKIDTKREETLGNILALDNIWTPENIPRYDFGQFQQRDEYQEIKEEYSLYIARVEALTVNLAQIEDRLNMAYGLDETWIANNTPTTIRKLYDDFAEQEEYRLIFDEFKTELTPVTMRLAQLLENVENETDKTVLRELAQKNDKPVEIVRAAWKSWRQRNQQENPQWPDSQSRREVERKIRDQLQNRYQNDIADTGRRRELVLELTQAENEDLALELEELADRVSELARFGELVLQETGQIDDQDQLLTVQKKLKQQGNELALFVEGPWAERVAQSTFQEEHPLPFTADEIPSSENFAAWQKNVVEPYYILAKDPRDEWDQLQAEIETLMAQYIQAAEQSNRTPEDFKPKLEDLLGQYSKQQYAGIEKYRQHINTGDQELKQLAQGVQAELEKLKPSADDVAGLEEEIRKADGVSPLFRDNVWARVANQAASDLKANTLNYWRLSLYVPEVKRQLRQLEVEFQPNKLPPINGRDWVADLAGAEKQAHNDAQAELISKITAMGDYPDLENAGFKSDKDNILNKYRQWETDLQGVVDGLVEVKNHLDRGYTLEGNLSGNRKIAQLRNRLQENQVYALVDANRNPILTRVATLEALPSASRRDDLVGRTRQINDKENPEIIITLWSRLGEVADWPGDRKDLDQEESLRRQVDRIAAQIRSLDDDHYQALSNELSRQGPRRWLICFKRLSQHDEIKDAVDRMTDFGVEVDQQNDPRVKFNIKLCEFRERVSSLTDQEDNQPALLLTQEFIKLTDELSGEAKSAKVEELRKNLNDLVAESKELMKTPEEASRSNLEQAGPALALLADKWKMESSDRQSVQYIWPGHNQKLDFIFIRPGGGADSFYLCTTEISLDLFIETIKSSDQGSQIGELVTRNVKSWRGPLGWSRNRYNTDEIQRNMGKSGWLFRSTQFDGPFYPSDLAPNIKNPRPNHPIQRVSAAAALYFAQLLGCRLPTAAEWRATYDKCQEEGGLDPKPNLRDRTWQTQFEYILQLIKDDQTIVYDFIPWMDMVFQGENFQDILSADALDDHDDGTLWFAEVDAGADQDFHHLVGNVAEFAYEDPEDFENWFQVASNQSAENVENYLKDQDHLDKLTVIGGSALSPPGLTVYEPHKVDELIRDGYSDVGFRLAFTAPSETLADQVMSLLTDQSYYLQIESLSGNKR